MDKLTQFLNELSTNTDQLDRFNSGSNKTEMISNRQRMLDAAGVQHKEEIVDMNLENLQNLMNKNLAQKTDNNLETTICGLIVKQMLKYPERIAIIDRETKISYKELMIRAAEVAGELINRKVTPGSLVGVCMNRTWELVAALIGVMQAGCAYVPLDPAYPQNRVKYMLEHSRAVATIVDNEVSAELCSSVQEQLRINKLSGHIDHSVRASGNDLAYVIYTSGSTGKPKGVAVEHKGFVCLRQSMRELFSDEELKGVFAGASVCFDTSVMEIMGTLSLGGTIILAKNALELTKLPAIDQIKVCVMVASAMQALLTTEKLPKGLKCLVFGGEALKPSLVAQVYKQKPDVRVLNAYGPTEDTVYSTIAEVSPGTEVVTIGKSVPNSRAYILDEALQPVATGVAGELYLAGTKLARGYLYDEVKTKERFIDIVPNDLISANRLYKTGDLCCWTENGEIEFLGRVDQQVKIRGYRIELEEIESILESMEGIDAAATAAVDGGFGQKILVAYIVSKDKSVTENEIKSYVSRRLPKYMVPQVIKYLKALPLLPNDKLDRKKLMSLEEKSCVKKDSENQTVVQNLIVSKDEQQGKILSIVQNEVASLLNLDDPEQVSPEDAFDNLGLDSLTTLEFSCRLTNLLGRELSAHAIFEHSTPNALVNYITNMMRSGDANSSTNGTKTVFTDTLASFQTHIRSSHPTFQAAKAPAWDATDKSKLVQEVLHMVNNDRRNPYSKVLRTGSATKGIVGDAYNDEEQEAIIWTTNLYLGLNRDQKVMEEASNALARFGTGMGTSAAASGMTNQHLEFETEFADLVGKPSACLFPTGYTANVGAIAGLLGRNDVVIIDQLCHASIVDGARLCGATVRTFQHNSASDLEEVLKSEMSPYRTILVVFEGVYSMGEGAAPVAEIVRTAKKYNALVLVDEAHSFGFYGENGAGICAAQGVTEEVDFIMTTLSKALGSLGGVVAASQEHVDLLKSSSRAYIFQASISPADMAAALTALRRLRSDDALRERLWDTTRYMRKQFEDAGYDLGTGDGPIVTPHFSDKDKLYAIVQNMYQQGVQTSAVTYPIVESGRGRLRLICSAAHTREDVDRTLAALIEAERKVDEQLTIEQNEIKDSNISISDIEAWAKGFSLYLKRSMAVVAAPTPNLAISVKASEASKPVTILVKDEKITINTDVGCDLPSCSLIITDNDAVSTLQSSDVQGLLHCICKGTCILKGQVEPFIWFIGRMVDHRNSTQN
ncbi:amino acid adenylation domain-containing protein [Aquimarina spongiae]|uniref:Amino acid adenylation domain-containing protein n=1 Tax=Aquimarina spongiae TaxID=570521 RepID=A0A1M6G6V5_9FLAO|nr:amino acid adenylation domain-containing protein [Aquimarina spongiae]SHJ05653.1 amino acid adenylation domain-containing protein [Aquimarina spongiae]